jgi:hypothetical protein
VHPLEEISSFSPAAGEFVEVRCTGEADEYRIELIERSGA